MLKILFIVNPFSGIGKQNKIEQLIGNYLDKNKFLPDIKYTEYAGHASEISKKAVGEYDIVVAVGGDGSVNEVSRGLINSDTILAVIPTGSGNGFARHLKLPLNPEKAIKVINNLNIKTIDTAQINNVSFVNVAGTGYDAEMGYNFSKLKKRGFSGYAKVVISSFHLLKGKAMRIRVDKKEIENTFFLVTFANGSQFGLNAKISPFSKVDDRIAEVITIKKFPIFTVPFIALKLFTGKIHKSKYVKIYNASELKISVTGETIVHADGEPFKINKTIEIKIIPKSLKIIVPL